MCALAGDSLVHNRDLTMEMSGGGAGHEFQESHAQDAAVNCARVEMPVRCACDGNLNPWIG